MPDSVLVLLVFQGSDDLANDLTLALELVKHHGSIVVQLVSPLAPVMRNVRRDVEKSLLVTPN